VTDAALVALAREGDVNAFRELVKRYYEGCNRFARRMLGDRDDAEDALQETLLNVWRGLPRYRERDAFHGWLYRILVNECRRLAVRRWRIDRRLPRQRPIPGRGVSERRLGAWILSAWRWRRLDGRLSRQRPIPRRGLSERRLGARILSARWRRRFNRWLPGERPVPWRGVRQWRLGARILGAGWWRRLDRRLPR
jgi:RNA polymerase sigma factor (sigma-70 family)